MTTAQAEHAHAHADHAHGDPAEHLAHHFDDKQQQFDSGKLGIWLFLVTEVLFFSGLFCAYTLLRAHHPEMFTTASRFLDTTLGAVNTVVLLFSSLTAAWAVRNAQLGQQKMLIVNILLTVACAATFMVVKYFEYTHKFHLGVYPGGEKFDPNAEAQTIFFGEAGAPVGGVSIADVLQMDASQPAVKNLHLFFSVYYGMTGLHGIHVIGGIIVWLWILRRAMRGEFGPKFFGPVDFTALYWHVVDIIWIYLFPLLYLIR
jgi:cytochrome c oxidase subunit III